LLLATLLSGFEGREKWWLNSPLLSRSKDRSYLDAQAMVVVCGIAFAI
jgi:hypothetical protein